MAIVEKTNYYEKYLKYKSKYNELKTQQGGAYTDRIYFLTKEQCIAFITPTDSCKMNYRDKILYCCNVKTYEEIEAIKDKAYELLDGDNKLKKIGSESIKDNINIKTENDKNYKFNDLEYPHIAKMINIINSKKSPPLIEYIIYINVKVLSSENIIEVIGKINKNKDGIIVITNTIIDMISKWDKTDVIIGL